MLWFPKDAKKYIKETGCLMKEQINIYRQHIWQPQYQQLAVEEHVGTCGNGKFHMFPFFKILQENKSLRKFFEDYFIDKFKPLLNKKSQVVKPPKAAVLNMTSTSYCILDTNTTPNK